jgi:hypothetical protein
MALPSNWLALAARVFVVALLVYVSTAGGSLATTDAVVAFDVTKSICEHGSLAMSGNLLGMEFHRGVDGRYYSPFGIAQSIYNIPFYLAGRAAQHALGIRLGKSDTVTKAAVALGGTVAAAACVALTFLLALAVGCSAPAALTAAILLAFATVFWPYAKFGFNAPLAACCLVGGALALCAAVQRRESWRRSSGVMAASGLAFGAALLTRHELAIVLLPVGAYLVLQARRGRVGRMEAASFALGFGAGFIAWMVVNAVRFGNPLNPGYLGDPHPALGSSLAGGLHGLLLSPAASLFLYCPLALLAVPALYAWWRRDRTTTVLLAGIVLTLLLFYAQLGNWAGGRSYGPRYLVPALPFLAVAVASWLHVLTGRAARAATITVCALSALVQAPGVLVDFSKVSVAWARQYSAASLPDRRVEWSACPMLLNARAAVDAAPRNLRYLMGAETPPRPALSKSDADRDFSQQFAFSLDFWWLYLFYLGAWGAGAALLAGLAPLAVAAVMAWRLAACVYFP